MNGSDISYLNSLLENTDIKIVERENKIFINKNINGYWYEILFENDCIFFKYIIKTRKKTNFSNLSRAFEPKEADWEFIRRHASMVYVIIAKSCNSKCKVCFAQGLIKPEDMDVDDIKYVLSKIGNNKKFMFFGLEPTVNDNLFNMIKIVEKSGNIPTLFTNGLKLANPDYVKELKLAGLKEVFVSFDGFKDVYKKLDSENDYNLKVEALKNLENNKIFTFLALVFMEGINENEIPKLVSFLMRHKDFIKGLFLVPLSPFGKLEISQKKFFTYSDIIKNIARSGNVKCDKDYFVEFERFKFNIHKLLLKFRKNVPTGSQIITVPFKISDNSLNEVISTKDLKRINLHLENGHLYNLVGYLPKFIKFWSLLLNSTKFYYTNLNRGLIYISIYQITTDFNYIPFWTHSVGIIKQKMKDGKNAMMFNCI
ncbi:MAG: radical SAM protein [Candidatus Omnitrophica bacterium]|nr:radical SAM protein [Candidatus Omnitrophota bacterium]